MFEPIDPSKVVSGLTADQFRPYIGKRVKLESVIGNGFSIGNVDEVGNGGVKISKIVLFSSSGKRDHEVAWEIVSTTWYRLITLPTAAELKQATFTQTTPYDWVNKLGRPAAPQAAHAPTVGELTNFLRDCPSAALGVVVSAELNAAAQRAGLNDTAPLNQSLLGQTRLALCDRELRQDAVLIMADSMRANRKGNSGEERIQFIENIQSDLNAGKNLDFADAFTRATNGRFS